MTAMALNKEFDLGTTGFFVHNHHGASLVDLQIDMLPLIKSFASANDFESRVITVTVQAIQVRDPSKIIKLDKKMFEGTASSKVEAELEFRLSRRG